MAGIDEEELRREGTVTKAMQDALKSMSKQYNKSEVKGVTLREVDPNADIDDESEAVIPLKVNSMVKSAGGFLALTNENQSKARFARAVTRRRIKEESNL